MAAVLFLLNDEVERAVRRERVFRDRSQPLDFLTDDELISRYRFPRRVILELVGGVVGIGPATARCQSIPLQLQVLCTLRYLAKADFFSEVGDIHGISKSSISQFLPKVCQALSGYLNNIHFPTSVQKLREIKEKFYQTARFPNVIGAIDGTLIPIRGMSGNEEPVYVCRKNYHALNIQGVVDAEMRFLNINCRFPGSTHDAYIFSNSNLPGILSDLRETGWLLGDSGYPLKDHLMTPFPSPTNNAEEKYNTAHSQTRNVVERAFGVLKARFRCLHKSGGCLPFTPKKSSMVIELCMRLHNKAIDEKVPLIQGGPVLNKNNGCLPVQVEAVPQSARNRRQQIALTF